MPILTQRDSIPPPDQPQPEGVPPGANPGENKLCSVCGQTFVCWSQAMAAGGRDCWCREIAIKPEAAAILRTCQADCVCPACLRLACLPK